MACTNVPPLQPHICVKGGLEAIAFYERALGAENMFHQLAEDGRRVMHANLAIYGGEVMLHDEFHGLMPRADVLWGARYARITDPSGHVWAFNAPLEQK